MDSSTCYVSVYLPILEGLAAATAELIGTASAPEVHAATSGQIITHVTLRTLCKNTIQLCTLLNRLNHVLKTTTPKMLLWVCASYSSNHMVAFHANSNLQSQVWGVIQKGSLLIVICTSCFQHWYLPPVTRWHMHTLHITHGVLTYSICIEMSCQSLLLSIRIIILLPLGKLLTCSAFMLRLPLHDATLGKGSMLGNSHFVRKDNLLVSCT